MSEGRSQRVLVVIQNSVFRETVCYLLAADARFMIAAQAESGEAALALKEGLEIDLALVDIHLPGMGGFATATALKMTDPHLIILILSGEWSSAYERKAKAAGITARLAKQTFSLSELYRVLDSARSMT